ncbi:epoxyqueuosine reductase QueH [Candidatus Margulisiibacteriota bacterium]
MRVLVNICGPAEGEIILRWLKERGYEAVGYFFNPNLHPYEEYRKVSLMTKMIATLHDHTVIFEKFYDNIEQYFKKAGSKNNDTPAMCSACYQLRLEETARMAKKNTFDAFTSTLLTSQYRHHDEIQRLGMLISKKHKIKFLYEDLRKYRKEIKSVISHLNLYEQPYCGCVFSEKDYHKVKSGDAAMKKSERLYH